MKTAVPRTLTLFDAVVLVAATASAFALFRIMRIDYLAGGRQLFFALIVQHGAETILPFLMMWSLAVAGLRLRQPRPPFRKLARQPGMIACCAVMLTLVIEVIGIIVGELMLLPNAVIPRTIPPYVALSLGRGILHNVRGIVVLQSNAGGAVAAAWLILKLAGVWRSEPTWIDRFGRALGVSWLAVNIAVHAALLLI